MAEAQRPQQGKSESTAKPSQAQEREPARAVEPYRAGGREIARPGVASSPFSLMGRLMSDMERMFENFGLGRGLSSFMAPSRAGETGFAPATWIPQVDIFERAGQLVVHADLPGLRQDDVNVDIDNGVLTISGERTHEHEHESGGVYRCERGYGAFQRSLALPEGVNPESIQASFENGVLEVTMPMPQQQQQQPPRGRAIPIRSSSQGPDTRH